MIRKHYQHIPGVLVQIRYQTETLLDVTHCCVEYCFFPDFLLETVTVFVQWNEFSQLFFSFSSMCLNTCYEPQGLQPLQMNKLQIITVMPAVIYQLPVHFPITLRVCDV